MKLAATLDAEQNSITDLPAPVAASDAATKAYVDAVASGLDPKASCRVVATADVNTASPGGTIDGVTLASGDRVLLAGQTTASQNGIWVWNGAASAMTRAADADAAGELSGGSYTFVEAGTVYADTGWVVTTDGPITPGTTAHAWTQFTGGGGVSAGDGLTKTGSVLAVDGTVARKNIDNAFSVAQSIARSSGAYGLVITNPGTEQGWIQLMEGATQRGMIFELADGLAITSNGGNLTLGASGDIDVNSNRVINVSDATAASDAMNRQSSDARYARKASVDCAAATTTTVTHNFNTRDVVVSVIRASSPYDEVEADVEATDANTVTVRFLVAPSAGQYRITVMA